MEREVIRRELVHVPMYTNDKELLGTTTFKDLDITSDELKKYKDVNISSDEIAKILEENREEQTWRLKWQTRVQKYTSSDYTVLNEHFSQA